MNSITRVFTFRVQDGKAIEQLLPPALSAGNVQARPVHPLPDDKRPLSKRRQQLALRPDGGRAELAKARRSAAGLLRAHSLSAVAALRLQAGLSQEEAAERSGILQPHISRLENGQVKEPELATIKSLSQAYNCSIDAMVNALDAAVRARHGQ